MKLTTDRIVDAGMAAFNEVGYQGLSMRQVAERLDVHAGSLYYHVRNKSALLQLMADRVAQQAYDAGSAALAELAEDADWQTRIEAQAITLRESIKRHPGGPILLADSPKVLSPGALSLMERLLQTLSDAGVPAEHQIIVADTLLSHITGFVLQEQREPLTPAVDAKDIASLGKRFPMTIASAPVYDQDEKFIRSVRLLCAAAQAQIVSVAGSR
ncbi:TetR/AcrR family transcriptional regulator C-terminal domain-containing protein [Streptosporangium sp. NBC_01639]|uniref:TetR/AcrR family transcriptional regulator C-terminal domain-containing protein n=1 Tax=Streptosporangium sp. NBC_01639 TaxID=2975948 RepID=UPI00386BE36B|nr:TetR/AcrR family transcriptional regulator C-terminal domain-containing protein [Streptosporangium sp. NBC_01639]